MIEKLIIIILIELIIVLGMLIISWIFNYFFYEEPSALPPREQSHDFTIVLSKEQAEEFKKLFEDNDD